MEVCASTPRLCSYELGAAFPNEELSLSWGPEPALERLFGGTGVQLL